MTLFQSGSKWIKTHRRGGRRLLQPWWRTSAILALEGRRQGVGSTTRPCLRTGTSKSWAKACPRNVWDIFVSAEKAGECSPPQLPEVSHSVGPASPLSPDFLLLAPPTACSSDLSSSLPQASCAPHCSSQGCPHFHDNFSFSLTPSCVLSAHLPYPPVFSLSLA